MKRIIVLIVSVLLLAAPLVAAAWRQCGADVASGAAVVRLEMPAVVKVASEV